MVHNETGYVNTIEQQKKDISKKYLFSTESASDVKNVHSAGSEADGVASDPRREDDAPDAQRLDTCACSSTSCIYGTAVHLGEHSDGVAQGNTTPANRHPKTEHTQEYSKNTDFHTGPPNNIGPVSSQYGTAVYDTLHVRAKLRWGINGGLQDIQNGCDADKIINKDSWLELLKDQQDLLRAGELEIAEVDFGGFLWQVQRHGIGTHRRYDYYLKGPGGLGIAFGAHTDDSFDCNIYLSSVALHLAGGLGPLWDDIKARLALHGIQIEQTEVFRADLCLDMVGVPVSEFCERYRERRYICRSRNVIYHTGEIGDSDAMAGGQEYFRGRNYTGIVTGAKDAPLRLRIYDKLLETQYQPEKRDILWDKLHLTEWPEHITRIEFQMRTKALRQIRVNGKGLCTVEDLIQNQNEIWQYLTEKWCVFTENTMGYYHYDRAKTWDVWRRVQCARGFTGTPAERVFSNGIVLSEDLQNQLIGLVASLTADAHGGEATQVKEMTDLVLGIFSGREFYALRKLKAANKRFLLKAGYVKLSQKKA